MNRTSRVSRSIVLVVAVAVAPGCTSTPDDPAAAVRTTLLEIMYADPRACDLMTTRARRELVDSVPAEDCAGSVALVHDRIERSPEAFAAFAHPVFGAGDGPWTPPVAGRSDDRARVRVRMVPTDGTPPVEVSIDLIRERGTWLIDEGIGPALSR